MLHLGHTDFSWTSAVPTTSRTDHPKGVKRVIETAQRPLRMAIAASRRVVRSGWSAAVQRRGAMHCWLAVMAAILLAQPESNLQGAWLDPEDASPSVEVRVAADSASQYPVTPCLRPGDQIWVISSRRLPANVCGEPPLEVAVCEASSSSSSSWRSAELKEFLYDTDFPGATVIYVHGNRCTRSFVVERGALYYRILSRRSARPLRLVLWSWPSDQIKGALNDIRTKAVRTNAEAYYLGWVLRQMPHAHHVSLIGYSYGSRIIVGAMHAAAGGRVAGRQLTDGSPCPANCLHAVLLAAALDYRWMCPGGCFQKALVPADRVLITVNRKDPVLKRYRSAGAPARRSRTWRRRASLLPRGCKVQELDVSQGVGRSHDELSYLCDRSVLCRAAQVLLGDLPESSQAAAESTNAADQWRN